MGIHVFRASLFFCITRNYSIKIGSKYQQQMLMGLPSSLVEWSTAVQLRILNSYYQMEQQ